MNCDVLICGSGAAGLTLAIDLARRGVSARVIEKLETPFGGSRGKGIQPRTLEIFEDLGVVDQILARGGLYPVQRHYLRDGTTRDEHRLEKFEPSVAEPYRTPLNIPQFITEAVLRAKLFEYGREVEFATELVSFSQNAESVEAHLSTGEVVSAQYLVGCDGGRSFVRHHLGVDFPGENLGIRVITADVRVDDLTHEVGHNWNDDDIPQRFELNPQGGTDLFTIIAPVPTEGEYDLSAKGLTALMHDRTGRRDLEINEVTWASIFTMSARLAAKYRIGRVFLCGDAAHVHPPTGGQGLNTSVQDAYNLGWKLQRALGGDSRILDTYEEERRPIAEEMIKLALKILDREKEGSNKRGRDVLQLDLTYAGSSLGLSEPAERERIAGDRAPDARLVTAGGLPRRLFEIFRGPHFTMICLHTSRAWTERENLQIFRIGQEIHDPSGELARTYGLNRGDVVIIRPDGYIGAVCSESQHEKIVKWLDEHLGQKSAWGRSLR